MGPRDRSRAVRADGGDRTEDRDTAVPSTATDGSGGETEPDAEDVGTAVLRGVDAPVVVYEFVDREAVIRRVNDAFATAFGCDADAVRDEPLSDALEGTDDLAELSPQGDFHREPVRRRVAEGWREFRLGVVPVRTAGDGPPRQVATYSDVGVREEYDRKLEALHRSTRELIQHGTKAAIARTAVDAAVEILGLPATSVHLVDEERGLLPPTATSDTIEDIIGEPPPLPIDDSLAGKVYRTGDPIVYEDPSQHPGVYNPDTPLQSEVILPLGDHGTLLCAATEPSAFSDADVSLATILASNTEAALDRVEREETLARRERELSRQNERLDAFASMVSHDLRNPLNVARGRLELAVEQGDLAHLEDVAYSLDRMEALIRDLLELARHGEELGEVESVDLASAARTAWDQVATGDATLTVADDLGSVEADPGRLAAVFENLYRNAVEHGSTSPRSHAREDAVEHGSTSPASQARQDAVDHGSTSPASQAREDAVDHGSTSPRSHAREDATGASSGEPSLADAREDAVEHGADGVDVVVGPTETGFFVEDDGVGVPPERRDRIFEVGYSRSEDGTGIGLAIVEEVIEAHGWRVSVSEGQDGGARFEIDVDGAEADGERRP